MSEFYQNQLREGKKGAAKLNADVVAKNKNQQLLQLKLFQSSLRLRNKKNKRGNILETELTNPETTQKVEVISRIKG